MRRTLLFVTMMIAAVVASMDMQAITVYYNNPDNWGEVSAYFYKGQQNSQAWPGVAMTKSGNLYSVTVPTGFEDGMVIFNNNNNGLQFPASGQDGKQLAGESMICLGTTIWTKYEAAAFKVYFDNSIANWATPIKLHYWGAEGTEWTNPVEMTQVTGTDTWEYTVPAGTGGIIFRSGNNQSVDLAAVKDHVYSNTADLGVYVPETVAEPFDVYFDNFKTGWAVPYIYFWGGNSTADYPGVTMTAVTGKDGIYKYTVPARTKKILFSAGGVNADATKTADLDATADHIYTQDGDQGEYASYTRNVDAPATLFILTNQGVEPMNPASAIAMTKNGNTFTVANVNIEVAALNGEYGYFTFAVASGADWNAVNAADRYGCANEDEGLVNGEGNVVKYSGYNAGNAKSWKIEPGKYTFTVNFETMKVTAVKTGSGPVAGEGTISVPEVNIKAGGDADLRVVLATETQMVALQLDITLPEVVTAGTPRLSDLTADHHVDYNTVDGVMHMVITSDNNTPFTRGNGILLYLPLTAAANAEVGEYDVTVSNVILSDINLLKATLSIGEIGKVVVEANDDITLTLDQEEISLQIGETATLVATVEPAGTAVNWRSSDTAVATVDATGKVTAVANGTAVITASAGSVKATCNVTVGKTAQTITWDQTLKENYGIGETINLAATASSGLDVTFAITSGSAYASLEGNVLTCNAAGIVTIQARQAGNTTYAPANPVTRNITIWLGYKLGDVNGDGKYTAIDASMTIQHIVGKNPADFDQRAADVNGDGSIDVVDVTRIIDYVLKAAANTGSGKPARVAAQEEGAEQFTMTQDDYTIRVEFSNMGEYVATQFDLTLPEGNSVKNATIAGSDHRVAFYDHGNFTRVVAYSTINEPFASNGYITLTLRQPLNGPAYLTNALVDRVEGDDIVELAATGASVNDMTGISLIGADAAADCRVYTVDGICVFTGKVADFRGNAGVYIIRTAEKTVKVVL